MVTSSIVEDIVFKLIYLYKNTFFFSTNSIMLWFIYNTLLLQKTCLFLPVLPVSRGYDSVSLLIVFEDSRSSRILTSAPLSAPHDVFNKKTLRGPTKGHRTQQWLPGQRELSHPCNQCSLSVFVCILMENSRVYSCRYTYVSSIKRQSCQRQLNWWDQSAN